VIRNKFPDVTDSVSYKKAKGKSVAVTTRVIKDVIYSGENPDLQDSVLINAGKTYLASVSFGALTSLRELGVQSKTVPGTLVADVSSLRYLSTNICRYLSKAILLILFPLRIGR